MKKLFQYSALATVLVCASLVAQQEKDNEKPTLNIQKIEGGKLIIQEPRSFFLCNEQVSYIVRNDLADKSVVITRLAGDKFWGITPEKAHVNHKEQLNPLHGATIDTLAFGKDGSLCAVARNHPSTLFMFTGLMPNNVRMLSAPDIHDAQGNAMNGIAGLVSGTVAATNYTLVAVKNAAGLFGAAGSGIAVLRYDADEKEDKKDEKKSEKDAQEVPQPFFDILDASTGAAKGNKAYPINNTTPAVAIRDGAECVGNVVDMHWDVALQRFYIALHVTTKSDARADQGACGLLMARIENGALIVDPVVSHEALSGNNCIVGALGANNAVSLHKVRIMHASSGPRYAVVVGGNGKSEETSQMVYALPLAMTEDVELRNKSGMLAKKGTPAKPTFSKQNNVLTSRAFNEFAAQPGECFTSEDDAVRVGGSAQLPGPIVDIAVHGDCVVVGVQKDGNGRAAGAFYSHAIFDDQGSVVCWTEWQRVVGGEKKVLRVFPSVAQCRFVHEEADDCLADETTAWHKSALVTVGGATTQMMYDPQQACVEALFPRHDIFGITDYPAETPGVSGADTLSFMAFLGVGTVALVQTSEKDPQGIVRSVHDYGPESDRFTQYASPVLEECGTLTCSALGVRDNNAWLFVGGTQGLAVLAQANGAGWDATAGLGNGFSAVRNGFTFKKVGAHKRIRKLVCCNGYLYILTNKSLERIVLGGDQAELIMRSESAIFNDMIISGDLLLVATTDGLYRIDADGTQHSIELPGHDELSVAQLFVVSGAHASNIYVVARSNNYKETYVYRFFANKAEHGTSLVLMPDYPNNTKKSSYWLRYAAPQQYWMTDGITVYNYCSRLKQSSPHVSFMAAPRLHNKSIYRAQESNQLPLGIQDAHAVRAMVRNSATGSWLVAGDFGLRVNK